MIYLAFELLLYALLAIVLVPLATFVTQVSIASIIKPPRRYESSSTDRPAGKRVVVLVPAHNESNNVIPTLRAILEQVTEEDRVIVIADNCSDDTATHASLPGVEVVERFNMSERGKGYALDFGWRHALATGVEPDYALILDADCLMHPGGMAALLRADKGDHRPIQALYLCENAGETSVKQRVSEFAWRIKNWARALGYARLGLPCQLMGSGMLIPSHCLKEHSLASGHLVEDLQLGLKLACAGMPPRFCDAALVTSAFPNSIEAQTAQRTRWEHGHLSIITSALPEGLAAWVKRPRMGYAALLLDVAVPPLTLLLAIVGFVSMLALLWGAVTDSWLPTLIMAVAWGLTVFALGLGWLHYGKNLISLPEMLRAMGYFAWKLPLYIKFIVARQTEWVRTRRDRNSSDE